MKELGIICRVRIKKYRSYKEVGVIAPNLLNRNFEAETEPKVGDGRDRVQPVWAETLSFADLRPVQRGI